VKTPAQITDNIHTWVQAFALPLEHPYAAASGADGIARLSKRRRTALQSDTRMALTSLQVVLLN
jgi:hypothetical protein